MLTRRTTTIACTQTPTRRHNRLPGAVDRGEDSADQSRERIPPSLPQCLHLSDLPEVYAIYPLSFFLSFPHDFVSSLSLRIFCFSLLLFLLPLNILNLPLPLSPCSFSIEFVGHAKSGLVLLLQVKPAFSRTKLFSTLGWVRDALLSWLQFGFSWSRLQSC